MLLVRFALICTKLAFTVKSQGLARRSHIFSKLLLQIFLPAMTSIMSTLYALTRMNLCTYKPVGVSMAVSGPAEPALRINTSSEPPVALETSAAACSSLSGFEMSVSTILMFLRLAASFSSSPAVARLRMRAKTWLFESADFGSSS